MRERIGGLGGRMWSVAVLLALVLVASAALPALAAGVSSVDGDKIRMANTKIAAKLPRFSDPAGDQLGLDGTPQSAAPAWSDIKNVTVSTADLRPKLIERMSADYPPGAQRVFYGDGETLGERDRVAFVAVRMAKKLPNRSLGQQVEVGIAGPEATPVQTGSQLDTWAGTETFTLAGLFSNGDYDVGTTDVIGRQPGLELEADEYYDVETGAFGFYSPGQATWYLIVPLADDARTITVSARSSTNAGSVIDRLDLPGGGHFIDLGSPYGGYKPKTEGPLLRCRALETFNGEAGTIEGLDPDSNLVRYTATGGPKLLATAVEAAGPVSVAVSAVGEETEPLLVDGMLTASSEGDAVMLEFEVPEGQWTFALDGQTLKTPHRERVIDHMSLTGPAGVAVGPGLDGYVAGGTACAPSAVIETAADEVDLETEDEEAAP